MAGRGRGASATLPAWMSAAGAAAPAAAPSAAAFTSTSSAAAPQLGSAAAAGAYSGYGSTASAYGGGGGLGRSRSRSRERGASGGASGSSGAPGGSYAPQGYQQQQQQQQQQQAPGAYGGGYGGGGQYGAAAPAYGVPLGMAGAYGGGLPQAPLLGGYAGAPAAAAPGGNLDMKALLAKVQEKMSNPAAAAAAAAAAGAAGYGGGGYGGVGSGSQPSSTTRQFRRLYIGSLPPSTKAEDLHKFINDTINRAGYPGDHLISVLPINDKPFAFVEFRTMEMADGCLSLNGILFNGRTLKVIRPKDWRADLQPPLSAKIVLNAKDLGIIPRLVEDGPNKVFIGGLPHVYNEEALKVMLEHFGPLKALHLVRDPGCATCKGYGFFEFVDPANTAAAIEALHGYHLEPDKPPLNVRIATPKGEDVPAPDSNPTAALSAIYASAMGASTGLGGLAPYAGPGAAAATLRPYGGYVPPPPAATNALLAAAAPTNILKLGNMVMPAELADDTEYSEIKEDVDEELRKHGSLLSLFIPRRGPFMGFIFAQFAGVQDAAAAARVLTAKSFAGRPLAVTYETNESFAAARATDV